MSSWIEAVAGFHFEDPAVLLLVPVAIAALLARSRRRPPALRFAPAPLLEPDAPAGWRSRLRPLPRLAEGAALLLAVAAAARPVRAVEIPQPRRGIDLVLCIDLSSSMAARDMDARRSRLEVARAAAGRFAAERASDRLGVIGFARYADVIAPPTHDHRALADLLADLACVESDGPEDATAIGAAVARAAQMLRASDSASKVIVLLTDGEENVAAQGAPGEIAPLHAAQMCEALGVRVDVIVAGRGRLAPGGGVEPVDTRAVERLAARTGGRFFRAADAAAIEAVYREIDRLERSPFAPPRRELEERFAPLLGAALLFAAAGGLLRATSLRVLP